MRHRSTQFQERIRIERDLINRINHTTFPHPIHGVTLHAIRKWADENSIAGMPKPKIDQIVSVLHELVVRLKLDADKSRVVFDSSNIELDVKQDMAKLEALIVSMD